MKDSNSAAIHEFDVILLDVGLPRNRRLSVWLPGCAPPVVALPVLMLTAMDLEERHRPRHTGARAGWLHDQASFFVPRITLARIDSLTRRAKMILTDELRVADLVI